MPLARMDYLRTTLPMARISLFNFFASTSQKLGQAIESYDLEGMRKQLAAGGGQNSDYLLMRSGDRPGEMVPACKFSHPMKMARYVGMREEGMKILAENGFADDAYKAGDHGRKNLSR